MEAGEEQAKDRGGQGGSHGAPGLAAEGRLTHTPLQPTLSDPLPLHLQGIQATEPGLLFGTWDNCQASNSREDHSSITPLSPTVIFPHGWAGDLVALAPVDVATFTAAVAAAAAGYNSPPSPLSTSLCRSHQQNATGGATLRQV